MVKVAFVREFRYVYAAIGPQAGTLHWMVAEAMNTETMGRFLRQVGQAHPDAYVLMALDGASSHRAKALAVPENVVLVPLPPYSPELNPVGILWHELREKNFSNRVFDSLVAVEQQVVCGMNYFRDNSSDMARLASWPWIVDSISLIAT